MGVKIAKKDFEFLQAGRPEEVYSDFVHTFLPHPHTAQITRKVNVEAVKHSLRNIIFTKEETTFQLFNCRAIHKFNGGPMCAKNKLRRRYS